MVLNIFDETVMVGDALRSPRAAAMIHPRSTPIAGYGSTEGVMHRDYWLR